MATLPLAGIRVLDLSRVLAGPLCTMMLGDLGADVIKVERPGRGDDTRGWGPPFDDRGESAYYLSINRNKLSVVADLHNERDRAFVRELALDADIVVENFLPGTLDRLGVDPDDLLRQNERLLWCTITGFGTGSRRLGYDYVVQAESGWMAITGEPHGDPMKTGVALADILSGKDAAIAILAALHGRKGAPLKDRCLVISLAHSARAALANVAQNALVSGKDARRWGNAHANLVPYQLFHASDRPLVIAVGTDEQWVALARVLALPELAADDALASNAGRLAQRERVTAAVATALRSRAASEWQRLLDIAQVPCGVVKSVREAIADATGASPLTGMPSAIGGRVRFPPPRLDEHGPSIRDTKWGVFDRYH
jgi:crotonobetainyl-CoA:carnitine CoA-transferase CaiB-like acyl-CoA transferase